ncbi:ribbon-helix-helix CopG family protein [Novosphingobium sp. ST904]|nr:ribbon-helix-helix CopG family protein [Novosphingobium sp. ST904]
MTSSLQRMIRLDRRQYARLEKIAKDQGRPVSELIRRAISDYLDQDKILTASQLRQARLMEYTQAAIDTILREDHYDQRQLVIDETTRRMERYHGA